MENENEKILRVNSVTCYTYFVLNKTFRDENFEIEFEANVQQTDSYFYFGIVNETYSMTGSCMCSSQVNAYFVQCNGSIKTNGATITNNLFNWQSERTVIGMRVNLQEKTIMFYIPDKGEAGPFAIVGNEWKIVSGHCNTGNGTIKILSCIEI